MPEVETYRGHRIFEAVSATPRALAELTTSYRVRRPDDSQLAGGPFSSLAEARQAIDDEVANHRLRFVLTTRNQSEKDVVEEETDRRIGYIRFNGQGEPHSAFDVDGELISDQCPSFAVAKEEVIDADAGF